VKVEFLAITKISPILASADQNLCVFFKRHKGDLSCLFHLLQHQGHDRDVEATRGRIKMKGQGLLTRKVQMKLKMIQVDGEACAVGLGHFVSTVLSRLNGTTKNADVFNRRIMGNPYSMLPNL
jgi:hypothetical protein